MIMSGENIMEGVKSGWINIEPFDGEMLQPASIDIRLGNEFIKYDNSYAWVGDDGTIDPERDNGHLMVKATVADDEFVYLNPHEFMLGHTVEKITLSPRVAARIEGRSSFGRLGLVVHCTAGFIDPGFSGQITLEFTNLASYPIKLRPGLRVGQVCFIPLVTPSHVPYGTRAGSKYNEQSGATVSRSQFDFQ